MTLLRKISTPILFLLLLVSGCATDQAGKTPPEVRFAFFGNTHPDSPFKSDRINMNPVITAINEDNPLFLIHLGDIIHGGKEWMGIKQHDVTRQFRSFFMLMPRIRPILYTVKGDLDLFNDSAEDYLRFTRRALYYSFNYGNLHILVLDTTDKKPGEMGSRQKDWMKRDLERYKNYPAILVITHHPLFPPEDYTAPEKTRLKNAQELHNLFRKYPVKAVFSGHMEIYHSEYRNGILYAITGCNYSETREKVKNYNNDVAYYIVDYTQGLFKIYPKSVSERIIQKKRNPYQYRHM